jgi:uncharacterized membrane protein
MSETEIQQKKRRVPVLSTFAAGLMSVVFLQAASATFLRIGIPLWLVFLIIPGSLLGSMVNIPVMTLNSSHTPCLEHEYYQNWGIAFALYEPDCVEQTKVYVNVGGALIPLFVSLYLLAINPTSIIASLLAVLIVTGFVHRIARIKPNVGIVTPGLLPAIVAAFAAVGVTILFPLLVNPYVLAYVSGTLGTLIGADLLNLNKLGQLKTGKASIGGAGTWDGVFLTGIFAAFFL